MLRPLTTKLWPSEDAPFYRKPIKPEKPKSSRISVFYPTLNSGIQLELQIEALVRMRPLPDEFVSDFHDFGAVGKLRCSAFQRCQTFQSPLQTRKAVRISSQMTLPRPGLEFKNEFLNSSSNSSSTDSISSSLKTVLL